MIIRKLSGTPKKKKKKKEKENSEMVKWLTKNHNLIFDKK